MAEVTVTKQAKETAPAVRKVRWMLPFGEGIFGVDPFAMMKELTRDLDRAFPMGKDEAAWWPAMECKKANGNYVVRVELPGIKSEDVHVEVLDNQLVIDGERKFEEEKEEKGYFRSERRYGKFHREMALPEGVKPEEIKAELANGVLEVKVPVVEVKPVKHEVPVAAK